MFHRKGAKNTKIMKAILSVLCDPSGEKNTGIRNTYLISRKEKDRIKFEYGTDRNSWIRPQQIIHGSTLKSIEQGLLEKQEDNERHYSSYLFTVQPACNSDPVRN
jgi:hypothetical protein